MNIYPYFNSKDVAMHLEKIGFQFTAIEMARIINHCEHITLEEKHAAFRLLMEEMPDEIISLTSLWEQDKLPLSAVLSEYIETENKLVREFDTEEENCLYSCTASDSTASPADCFFQESIWETFQNAKKEFSASAYPYIHLSKFNFLEKRKVKLCLDKSGNVIFVENIKALCKFFSALSFSRSERKIPIPFQKGDLVCSDGDEENPMVFLSDELDFVNAYSCLYGGLCKTEDQTIPIDLKYYREELRGIQRVLSLAADFEKGKLDLSEFANQYHKIRLENYIEKMDDASRFI